MSDGTNIIHKPTTELSLGGDLTPNGSSGPNAGQKVIGIGGIPIIGTPAQGAKLVYNGFLNVLEWQV